MTLMASVENKKNRLTSQPKLNVRMMYYKRQKFV